MFCKGDNFSDSEHSIKELGILTDPDECKKTRFGEIIVMLRYVLLLSNVSAMTSVPDNPTTKSQVTYQMRNC